MAATCHLLARLSENDFVWGRTLPPDFAEICAGAFPSPLVFSSLRECFLQLSRPGGVATKKGLQQCEVDRLSGSITHKLSVAAMSIIWGSDERFWRMEFSRSSCYGKVAHLLAVCWLEISGKWQLLLPLGRFSISWRLKLSNPQGGRRNFLTWKKPVSFSCSVSVNGARRSSALAAELDMAQAPFMGFDRWADFEVGRFYVQGSGASCEDPSLANAAEGAQGAGDAAAANALSTDMAVSGAGASSPSAPATTVLPEAQGFPFSQRASVVELNFSLRELDCSYWKGGLFIDCLTLRSID